MQSKVIAFNQEHRGTIADYRSGDVVRVHRKIVEGSKERVQVFEGMIIAVKGGQSSSPMITVRKVSQGGFGVEIVVPVISPMIEKIEIMKHAKVRRSKLYYVRDKAAKALRFKYSEVGERAHAPVAEALAEEAESPEEAPAEDVAAEVEEKKA